MGPPQTHRRRPPGCLDVFLTLANACLRVGHWPWHFKDSVSVVIPKPGKPSYSTPKAFRPIVLLNTLGKLIEKMIANRCQFDMIDLDLVHPNQFGGVRQRSTEDAGRIPYSPCSRRGGPGGLKTSVIAFDIAQFFPSLNHEFLLAAMRKQGFSPGVIRFFESYLVQRFTSYCWNSFKSDPMQADVGVGQGSGLSPVLSALYIAPVMKLYDIRASEFLDTTLLSYVDDGDNYYSVPPPRRQHDRAQICVRRHLRPLHQGRPRSRTFENGAFSFLARPH